MLHCLLKIKDRRETRLRRRLTALMRQRQQTEALYQQCALRRDGLIQALNQLLAWSGTLPASKLMEHKQLMSELFHQEHALAQRLFSLSEAQKQLQAQGDALRLALVSLMKKKEKLRSLLNDER